MRLSIIAPTATALLVSMSSSTSHAQPMVVGARSLTIAECLAMISTDISEEFDFSEADETLAAIAGKIWDAANSYEWQKAYDAESTSLQKFPYLLCHTGTNEIDGTNLSGYQRISDLKAAVNYTEDKGMYFRALYNREDYLCVYGQLLASVASGITGEDFIVQPILPSLKFMKGSVDSMKKAVGFYNNDDSDSDGDGYNPSLDIVLCPGVAVADDDDAENIQVWKELPEETAAEIIAMLVPPETQTIASKLANSISNTYYMTSEVYLNATADMGEEATARSKMWKTMIQDYQESGKCNDVYSNRLTWTMLRATDPEKGVSLLHVEFDTTGNTIHDIGCMLTLSLAIAAHPNVSSVESRERVKTQNTVITWLTQSEVKEKRPFFDVGLDGSGQIVAVSDTGCDQNNCYFEDPNNVPNSFINTAARKIAQYKDFVDTSDYEYGHGTHVAGTIAGKRSDGPGMADGVAPGAQIAFGDIGDSNGALSLPLDFQLLAVGRSQNCQGRSSTCAHIHSASWGSELNFYTTQARNFDQFMYDNDDFLILIAAGNSGHGDAPNTVGSPATGKNIIAVGAHHNTDTSRTDRGLGPSYIADFSSRGPTSDGRTKPDLMAPGKAVLSAGALPDQVGECDPDSRPGANSKKDGVLSLQGTSMATPVVSGTAAIIRQYFEQGYYPTGMKNETNIYDNPSGALIKAVLMNGAQFLKGVDNGSNGVTEIKPYDNNQNFGRLALQHSLYLPGKTDVQLNVLSDRKTVQDQRSQKAVIKIDKSDGCAYEKLSVTLIWVEPGSSPGCTKCVLNDLDLSVELGGITHYPNNLGRPDRHNNAERVIISGVNHGDEATITVEGYNLMQNEQQYSLVATGCFGGVANQMFANDCSVFDCDESESKRTQTILMAVFIPLGVLLLCGCGMFFMRRRKRENDNYDGGGVAYDEDV